MDSLRDQMRWNWLLLLGWTMAAVLAAVLR